MVAVGDDDPGVLQTNEGDVHFVYNDQGTRVFKIQGGNVNVYVNQFYTLQNLQSDPLGCKYSARCFWVVS